MVDEMLEASFVPSVPTAEAFAALADIVYATGPFDAVYRAVCDTAAAVVPGCDHVSLMLRHEHRTVTGAASDAVAQRIDELERELDEGPCIDAIETEGAHVCADLSRDYHPWPLLVAAIHAELPVRGMAGFRIVQQGRKVGSLNLFSDRPGVFTLQAVDQAAVLASFASVALAAVQRGEEASTMRAGLISNREIGKAVGLLMATHEITDDEAFGLLTRASQDLNVKLATVAHRLVADQAVGDTTL